MQQKKKTTTNYNCQSNNTIDSKWNARDPYKKNVGLSLYFYCKNQPIYKIDSLGFDCIDSVDYVGIKAVTWSTSISKEEKQQTINIISGAGQISALSNSPSHYENINYNETNIIDAFEKLGIQIWEKIKHASIEIYELGCESKLWNRLLGLAQTIGGGG